MRQGPERHYHPRHPDYSDECHRNGVKVEYIVSYNDRSPPRHGTHDYLLVHIWFEQQCPLCSHCSIHTLLANNLAWQSTQRICRQFITFVRLPQVYFAYQSPRAHTPGELQEIPAARGQDDHVLPSFPNPPNIVSYGAHLDPLAPHFCGSRHCKRKMSDGFLGCMCDPCDTIAPM